MNRLLCLVVVIFSGCTMLDREISRAQGRLLLTETKAKLQTVELQMCRDRADHSAKCPAGCKISKAWHQDKWNKK